MRPHLNRLPEDAPKGFAGAAIDRARAVRFRLDGRLVSGFAGDTVLSALLASGIDTLGTHLGVPVGLTRRGAPTISHAGLAGDPQRALPMARTPAIDGAELVTLGRDVTGPLARLFQPGRTLGMPLERTPRLPQPWRGVPAGTATRTQLVVIGGGVAGLSAALAGARVGLVVTLMEADAFLGGASGLFGTQEGEDGPDASIGHLIAAAEAHDAITILTSTTAFALRRGLVRAHVVEIVNGTAQGRVIDIAADHVVIASGALERLPIFAGNRLPGVQGTLDAYQMATRYGIWPGSDAILATGSSPTYRLAMMASDAGIGISRILDSRPGPRSRFIEFSRAYGIVQSPGTHVVAARLAKAGGALVVHGDGAGATPLLTDRLLVCGGWQPDLTLWHVAGGESRWSGQDNRLEAFGPLAGIVLAGSAAGYCTRRGCIDSGRQAVDQLLGRNSTAVADAVIDPAYETPDAPPALAAAADGAPAYLDDAALLHRPGASRQAWWRRPSGPEHDATMPLSQALDVSLVAAYVDLRLVPADAAGLVAQERVAMVPVDSSATHDVDKGELEPAPDYVPDYLAGRFGSDARVVRLAPLEERQLETGALVYRSSDISQPLQAIGVVLRPTGQGVTALMADGAIRAGLTVSVRDRHRAVPARLVED